jgi:hypothetical protein
MIFDCGKLVEFDKYLLVELLDDCRPWPFIPVVDLGRLELLQAHFLVVAFSFIQLLTTALTQCTAVIFTLSLYFWG